MVLWYEPLQRIPLPHRTVLGQAMGQAGLVFLVENWMDGPIVDSNFTSLGRRMRYQ